MIEIRSHNFGEQNLGTNTIQGKPDPCSEFVIDIRGEHNQLIFGENVKLKNVYIRLRNNATLIIEDGCDIKGNIFLFGSCTIKIGKGTKCTRPILLEARTEDIIIGNECLFADAEIYAMDHHRIGSLSDSYANQDKKVIIGDHVWFARNTFVTKGTVIESNTVIGARAVVSGKIPNNCVVVGNPAKVVKEDISWGDHFRHPPVFPRISRFSKKSLKLSRRMLWKLAVFFKKVKLLTPESFEQFLRSPTDNPCQPGVIGQILYRLARYSEKKTLKALKHLEEKGY